ncbi:hypothetical protein [Tortoise microvirus 13]|nr:hypothetical protein [Tortoise microvirus 13]QCS37024.1 hypothetical protein [Tortoise microvirus 13]
MFKKTKSINRSTWNIKNKKIMYWKKIKNEICVEVFAMDEEGTKVIIREIVGDKGIHETYMNIYDKLMNMGENVKWEVHCVRSRSINSVYYNEIKEEEV